MSERSNIQAAIQPAVVVVTFNRPEALARILRTIATARYDGMADVPLIISVDKSVDKSDRAAVHTEVLKVAEAFEWTHGSKRIIAHRENLGLKKHVISCGDLTQEHGAAILLEDDLLVSPEYYQYAVQALNFYGDQPKISGISLYSYDFNEYAESRFMPLEDGFDNYFIQTACSWGQAWTASQWSEFKDWYESCSSFAEGSDRLPQKLLEWSERSWKKFFIKYMILTDKYFVYPRVSLSTNSGESGANHRGSLNYQVPLQLGRRDYRFSQLESSRSRYDGYYELEASCLRQLNPALKAVDFECDLYGTKLIQNVKSTHLLSIKECANAIFSYDLSLVPQELNIAFKLPGSYFSLGKVADFSAVSERAQVAQLKCLHKNLGWHRYQKILVQTLKDRLRKKLSLGR